MKQRFFSTKKTSSMLEEQQNRKTVLAGCFRLVEAGRVELSGNSIKVWLDFIRGHYRVYLDSQV